MEKKQKMFITHQARATFKAFLEIYKTLPLLIMQLTYEADSVLNVLC